MTMDFTATAVAPNGDISYEFVMSEVSVDDDGGTPGVKQQLESMLGTAKGMNGKGVVSSRGFNRGAEVSLPPNANPQLQQTMGQMKDAFSQIAVPVPEEPVGVGGKWEVRLTMKQQGMVMKQIGTYEITAINGEQISARTTVKQSADPQPMVNPQMPSVKMELMRMGGGGDGEVTFNLGKGMPEKAAAKVGTEMQVGVEAGGQKQEMTMKMDLDLKVDQS
jgi:hypothetical protein